MTNETRFNGLSSVPSDYDSPDGDLSLSLNLIHEDGNLKPIIQPNAIRNISPYYALAIHSVSGKKNLILFNPENKTISFTPFNDADAGFSEVATWNGDMPVVAIIGNTLVFSNAKQTLYVIWNAETGKYNALGDSIPEIQVLFALSHDSRTGSSRNETVKVSLPDGYSADSAIKYLGAGVGIGRPTIPPRTGSDMFAESLSNAVMGALNKFITEASSANLFVQPFMVRWALRLYDGTYTHHSAPILMIPNSVAPVIAYTEPSSADGSISIPIAILARECSLMFRVLGLSPLSKWKDIVKSIDVFVSQQVFTYDQSGTVGSLHRTTDNDGLSISGVASPISTESTGGTTSRPEVRPPIVSLLKDDTIYSFPDGNAEQGHNVSGHLINPARFSKEHIEKNICDISQFYLVSSIPLFDDEELAVDMEGFAMLDMEESSLTNLVTRPRLEDDFRSHEIPHFSHAFTYNSRTILSGVASSLFKGFSLLEMGQYKQAPAAMTLNVAIYVKIVRGSSAYWVSCLSGKVYDRQLPRFLFYPDPNATEMRIFMWQDGEDSGKWQKYLLPLKPHDFLNGAYWFAGIARESLLGNVQTLSTPPENLMADHPVPESSKVFVSEVNNPFAYPLNGRVTVGSTSVFATSAAVQALSQGQFGQFPLYAFTSEGIWALSISSSGIISAVQPVTRDVCINPAGITQLDSAVLFPSDRGLMLLSGSHTQCITDTISSLNCGLSPVPESFPSLAEVVEARIPGIVDATSVAESASLLRFIRDCGIIYDYPHQRLIVYSPAFPLALVFSLRSKHWGMMLHKVKSHIASYPAAIAVTHAGDVVDFASGESSRDTPQHQVTLSRPLKLAAPDILKTIDTLIIRGMFPGNAVAVVLYGSRDLTNWHPVGSSVTPAIRNIHGTPYRYFRIAIVSTLAPGESMSGASIQFTPRFTNRLR